MLGRIGNAQLLWSRVHSQRSCNTPYPDYFERSFLQRRRTPINELIAPWLAKKKMKLKFYLKFRARSEVRPRETWHTHLGTPTAKRLELIR